MMNMNVVCAETGSAKLDISVANHANPTDTAADALETAGRHRRRRQNPSPVATHTATNVATNHPVLATAFAPSRIKIKAVTRPGVSGDRIPWKDLSHGTSQ